MNLRDELFANQDLAYRELHKRIVPNVAPERIIGVRLPVLRKIATAAFRENADNQKEYYEEVMVYGFTLGMKKGTAAEHEADLRGFVPLIDNWAVCDSCCASFKFTKTYRAELFPFLKSYLSGSEYEIRFAVVMLMQYYLTEPYFDEVLALIAGIESDYYYVNMAAAWAIAEAFIRYRDKTLPLIESRQLPVFVHNKAIQKIRESLRVSETDKIYLKTLKIKT